MEYRRCFGSFQETFFVAHLSELLINDPKLEVVAYDMFIEGNNKSGSLKISRKDSFSCIA